MSADGVVVRAPASSANLGAGFDVFGMALSAYADMGVGPAPQGAQQVDEHHPAREAFARLGGTGDIWLQCNIPMARGLGFSGAVRAASAALAVVQQGRTIDESSAELLAVTAELEGHGDNAAASLFGGVVAYVNDRSIPFRLGPVLAAATVVAWVPDVTTSTDSSRRSLPDMVSRVDAVHNIATATQFALAFAHDDPTLLAGAADDRLHQSVRVPGVPGAAEAIAWGVEAGAWCGWLSGSGPTIALLARADTVEAVTAALPTGGHVKTLEIDQLGTVCLDAT